MPSPVYFEAAPLPHEARIIAGFLSKTMASFTFDDYLREMYLTVEDIKAMSAETQKGFYYGYSRTTCGRLSRLRNALISLSMAWA